MFELLIKEHFNAAHSLRGYVGKCANVHGHTWEVEVLIRGNKLDNLGMILDFGILKKIVKDILGSFDHVYINDLEDFKAGGLNPTAENLAYYLYNQINAAIKKTNPEIILKEVKVWESARACAIYKEE